MISRLTSAYHRLVPSAYFASLLRDEGRRLTAMAQGEASPFPTEAEALQEANGDRSAQLATYESGTCTVIRDGRVVTISAAAARNIWLAPVRAEIDRVLRHKPTASVFEAGCGHGINLAVLRREFGERIQIAGCDFTRARLDEGRAHFKELSHAALVEQSFNDVLFGAGLGQHDVVFSVGALLFANSPSMVIEKMARMARAVVMVEPLWEFAMPHQRAYLVRAGLSTRILRGAKETKARSIEARACDISFSVKNPAGVIVLHAS